MAESVFVDTSAFYALMIAKDSAHDQTVDALHEVRKGNTRWITTDYVMDESATLLNARGHHSRAIEILDLAGKSRALQMEWMDSQRFFKARSLFAKYHDQGFSFTDCFSFVLMRELKISKVLTKDVHFKVMGFEQLLDSSIEESNGRGRS
jgi:predicted nucleic acid-binding protein